MGLLPIVYEDVQCVEERVEIHLWHHPLGKVLCRHKVSAPSSLIGIMHMRSRRSAWVLSAPDTPLTCRQVEEWFSGTKPALRTVLD
jgi:hypothetical protein